MGNGNRKSRCRVGGRRPLSRPVRRSASERRGGWVRRRLCRPDSMFHRGHRRRRQETERDRLPRVFCGVCSGRRSRSTSCRATRRGKWRRRFWREEAIRWNRHNPSCLYRAASGEIEGLDSPGMPFGCSAMRGMNRFHSEMWPGDGLIVYSDGLTEAENVAGDMFGKDRVQEIVRARRAAPFG